MKNKESGQTLVEYLLLTLVLITAIAGVIKSDTFRNIVDVDGDLMQDFYQRMRYSYRHALPGKKKEKANYRAIKHDSYYNLETSKSRFFAPNAPYPR